MTIRTKYIEYENRFTKLEGRLSYDDSLGPRPAVLVSHTWRGLSDFECDQAEKLAQLGYVGFALDLYGKGILGSNPSESQKLMTPFVENRAMLQDRLKAAYETVAALDVVQEHNIAAMGFCFGGLCVLDMARANHPVKGVISVHGLFTPPPNIPKPSIDAKILALHGWDDPMVPPDQVLSLTQELTRAGADWQLHAYGNTMHAFTNPQANDPAFGTVYNATADHRSWKTIQEFLKEVFE